MPLLLRLFGEIDGPYDRGYIFSRGEFMRLKIKLFGIRGESTRDLGLAKSVFVIDNRRICKEQLLVSVFSCLMYTLRCLF